MYEDFDECDDPHCLACIDHQAAMADERRAEDDPLAEVARSHDDRAVARTERRLHDAG